MELSQFINFIGLVLGVAGTLLVGREMIGMKIEDIVRNTSDLKPFWSSFNDVSNTIRVRSYVMFGSFILFLSFLIQIISLFVPQGTCFHWLWTIPAIICIIIFTRFIDACRQRGVLKNIQKAQLIYEEYTAKNNSAEK